MYCLGKLRHHRNIHIVVNANGAGIRVDFIYLGRALSRMDGDQTAAAACALNIVVDDLVCDLTVA